MTNIESDLETHSNTHPSLRQPYVETRSPFLFSLLEDAEARANTLRHVLRREIDPLTKERTQFAAELDASFDHPKIMHHGHHHLRHVEKLTKKFINSLERNHPNLFTYPEVLRDLSAAMIFPYYHDLDQTFSEVRNLNGAGLKVKKGHGAGAAVMVLGMAQEYGNKNLLPSEESLEISAIAAIMILDHDNPEDFDKTFAETNQKAYRILPDRTQEPIWGEKLLELFRTHTLDLFSLSTSQILELTSMQKQGNGFIIDGGESIYGLAPSFEARFGAELDAMAQDTRPLLDNLSPQRKEMIRLLTLANWSADAGDMISPPVDQITRTLATQYSMERPFSLFHEGSGLTIEQAIDMVFNCAGNDAGSDDIRIMWEAVHAGHLSEHSIFSNLPEVNIFFRDNTVMGLIALRELGIGIMKNDMTVFDRAYDARLQKIIIRAEKLIAEGQLTSMPEDMISAIEKERDSIKAKVDEKHRELGTQYSESDIEKFKETITTVIRQMCERLCVSTDELDNYYQRVLSGEFAPSHSFYHDVIPIDHYKVKGNF